MANGFDNRPSTTQRIRDNILSNVSGIFSTRPSARYASGARCILRINGKISAFAFGISWRINTSVTEINTIDDYMPYELAPQRITVEGSISALHIPGLSTGTELWQADVLSFMWHRYITIEVRDVITNDLLFYTSKAVITNRSEDMKVEQLANVQLSFKAVGFRDERAPEPHTPRSSDDDSDGSFSIRGLLDKIPF